MTDFSDRIAALSPQKLSLLIQSLQPREPKSESPKIIPRRKQGGTAALSYSQQRLWFIDQLEPGSYAHNLLTAVRFTGCLNLCAMRRAIRELLRRHEVLRASFPSSDGRPVQIIMDLTWGPLGVIDIQSLSEERQEHEVLEIANEEVIRPFDLSRGPMLRILLIRFAPNKHILLFVLH